MLPCPLRLPAPNQRPATNGWGEFGGTVASPVALYAGLRYQSLTNTAALLAAVWGVREGLLAIPNERARPGRISFEMSPVALDDG